MKVESPYFPHIVAAIGTTLLFILVWLIFAIPLMAFFVTDDPFGFPQFSNFFLRLIALLVGINLIINFPLSRFGENLSITNQQMRWQFPLIVLAIAFLIYLIIPSPIRSVPKLSTLLVAGTFLVYWLILTITKLAINQPSTRQA